MHNFKQITIVGWRREFIVFCFLEFIFMGSKWFFNEALWHIWNVS